MTTSIRLFLIAILSLLPANRAFAHTSDTTIVNIPYMERPAAHRRYTNTLLATALESTVEKFGPFKIVQQKYQTVVGRQLLELEKGEWLSVATSMPLPEWLEKADVVHFPILKGLASYRMFFARQANLKELNRTDSLDVLKKQVIGQGRGWSTAKLLEDNGFQVMYGSTYGMLFPMLQAGRFSLLMRGIYEIEAELPVYKKIMPDLSIADGFAVYTYLPMYFFVTKKQPELSERLAYGLKLMAENGQFDALFSQYFKSTVVMLEKTQRRIFYLKNTNVTAADFNQNKPYLLEFIRQLDQHKPILEDAKIAFMSE